MPRAVKAALLGHLFSSTSDLLFCQVMRVLEHSDSTTALGIGEQFGEETAPGDLAMLLRVAAMSEASAS